MPKRKGTEEDPNQIAARIIEQTAGDPDEIRAVLDAAFAEGKDPAAVLLGRRGGKKGGPARAKKLTAKRRSEIASQAAQARWRKKP